MESLAFQRCQSPDEQRTVHDQIILSYILAVGVFSVAAGQCAHRFLIRWLADKVGGVLMLAGALGRRYIVILEHIHSLPRKDRVVIRGGQRVCDTLLTAQAIAAVLRLAVDDVAGDTDRFLHLQSEREIVAASASAIRQCGGYFVRSRISRINAVILK